MTKCARAGGCAVFNYPFLTSKERDFETDLDYFLARYYSPVQGRFTSPDEFTGGPDELYSFASDASANPTFYADPTTPQSLNKYQYSFNNPLRYVDPDGHNPEPPQDPVVVPLPGGRIPLITPAIPIKGPTDQQIKELPRTIWELPDPYLYPISQTIGYAPDPTTEPVPIPPLVGPAPKVQPNLMPRPIDKPNPKRHKNKKGKKNWDKDTGTRSGDKKPPGFKPRIPKRPQDRDPKPDKPLVVPPKPPKQPKEENK